MRSSDYYRQQAQALRELAKATPDHDAALAYNMRADQFEHLAERAETGHAQHREPPTPDEPAQQ